MAKRLNPRERLTDANVSRWTNGRLTTVAAWRKEREAMLPERPTDTDLYLRYLGVAILGRLPDRDW
jgi:hypothetical protein